MKLRIQEELRLTVFEQKHSPLLLCAIDPFTDVRPSRKLSFNQEGDIKTARHFGDAAAGKAKEGLWESTQGRGEEKDEGRGMNRRNNSPARAGVQLQTVHVLVRPVLERSDSQPTEGLRTEETSTLASRTLASPPSITCPVLASA